MRRKWIWYVRYPLAVIAVVLILWPLVHARWYWELLAIAVMAGLAVFFRFTPPRAWKYVLVASTATALFLCVPIFNGSMAWYQIGIAYGTRHYLRMGSNTDNNLPALLEQQWNFRLMDPTTTLPPGRAANVVGSILNTVDHELNYQPGQPVDVPLKYLLVAVYALSLLICSIGAAVQDARGSPRFLIAIAAPWIVFFAVMPQMHEHSALGCCDARRRSRWGPGWRCCIC